MTSLEKAENLKKEFFSFYNLGPTTAVCMVTGVNPPPVQHSSNLILAHIMPRSTTRIIREYVTIQLSDIDSIRNCLLLSFNIERAFDELDISFVPSDNPFQADKFKLTVWNDTIRKKPIFPGALQLIGEYDNSALNLVMNTVTVADAKLHNPFKRALSYQAYMAFRKWSKIDPTIEMPVDSDISLYHVNVKSYRNSRRDFADRFRRDLMDEVEDESTPLASSVERQKAIRNNSPFVVKDQSNL